MSLALSLTLKRPTFSLRIQLLSISRRLYAVLNLLRFTLYHLTMSLATPDSKRSRFRQWLSARGSTPSGNPHSPAPSPAPTTQSNASGTSTATQQDFQTRVFLLLSSKDRDTIQQHTVTNTTDVDALVQQALAATRQKQTIYQAKRWTFTFRGHTVVLREKADNIVKWLDQFKEVGDVASSVDPVHVGLPWAGIRFLLEVGSSFRIKSNDGSPPRG